jgi:hypothetical protein
MPNRCLLIPLLLLAGNALAQNQLWLHTSIKLHPSNFTYPSTEKNDFDNLPIVQASFGYSKPIGLGNWFWDLGISYFYTESRLEREFTIHPQDGFVQNGVTGYYIESLNLIGLKLGAGPKLETGKGQHNFLYLPFGMQGFIPFSCKGFTQIGDYRSELTPIYSGSNLASGIFYGIYVRPTYQFSLYAKSRWKFGIYGEGDLLILNKAITNPKWTVGAGIEIRYTLK